MTTLSFLLSTTGQAFDCVVEGILQLNGYAIVVGRIKDIRIQADGQPLLYWQGAYRQLALSEISSLE